MLTTNFDPLIMRGTMLAGAVPAMADGIDTLLNISAHPAYPQVVHLHGSMHNYRMLNTRKTVAGAKHRKELSISLGSLLQESHLLIVVGYRGAEEGVMDILIDAAKSLPGKPIYWIAHETDPDRRTLSSQAWKLLTQTGENKYVVAGQDADLFFDSLRQAVGAVPPWLDLPLDFLQTQITAIADSSESDAHEPIRRLLHEGRKTIDSMRTYAATIPNATLAAQPGQDWESIANKAFREGMHAPEPDLLQLSATAFRLALKICPRNEQRKIWARLQNGLGNALNLLGRRGNGEALSQAVDAYHNALEEYNRDELPIEWAIAQSNLGTAFQLLGQRGDEAALRQAIEAYQKALTVRTREALPIDWALTQNNLGNALQVLGKEDVSILMQSVEAYQSALEILSPDTHASDWAGIKNNLGNALAMLGEQGNRSALLQATAAYGDALEIHTRDKHPVDWAVTQNNLGNALRALGQMGDRDYLDQAIQAYASAMEVRTREMLPLDWATTQHNLALTLMILARQGDDEALCQAITALQGALEVYSQHDVPSFHQDTLVTLVEARTLSRQRAAKNRPENPEKRKTRS